MMRRIGGVIMGVAAAGTLALTGALATAASSTPVVTIDGQASGYMKSFSGLPMEADVIVHDLPPAAMRVQIGADMGAAWSSWLAATGAQGFVTRDLTVVAPGDPTRKVTLDDAIVTAITVPKLDGSSKEAAYFDVEFEAERVSAATGPASTAKAAAPGKRWLAANFRLAVDGLPCGRVTSVDGFTWRQTVARTSGGDFIAPAKVGDSMKRTALRLTLDAADAPAWSAWLGQFGPASPTKSGTLKIFDAAMTSNVTVTLKGVGIVAAKPDLEANAEKIARFDVELYVEKMEFKLNYAD